MAKMVQNSRRGSRPIKVNLGRQVLDIVTSGMYNNPLMVLREYIQNAADSIDEAVSNKVRPLDPKKARIDIALSGQDRTITISDNGTGISNNNVEERLGSLGFSHKEGFNKRGFRGIGRLGGLGYCDLLRFETRTTSREAVAVVEWDGNKLRTIDSSERKSDLKNAVRSIATISTRKAQRDDDSRFFRVTMVNVHRFHSDALMNLKKIKNYLCQVAPLPYCKRNEGFDYGSELEKFFSRISNYKTYNIYLSGIKLNKPYSNEFEISKNKMDRIKEIKKLTFTNSETGDLIGLGWFALTSFISSIPKSLNMRGVRVRHGNIEVGDARFLDHIYTERRFSSWHIGEIHLNHNITPNARRDGFEESPDYEDFLERVAFIGKGLSKLCLDSSSRRSLNQRAAAEMSQITKTTNSSLMLLDRQHCNKVINDRNSRLSFLIQLADSEELDESTKEQLNKLQKQVKTLPSQKKFFDSRIDGRKISNISKKKLIQKICKRIIDLYDRDQPIEITLEKVLKPYTKN